MSEVFRREVALEISRPRSSTFFDYDADVTTIRDLRMTFRVEKSISSKPNTAEITITNLNAESRGLFTVSPIHVRLVAGYDGETKLLCAGDKRWSESRRDRADWVTKVTIGDGERAYKHARVAKSYKAGTSRKTIVADLAASMGLKMPRNADDAIELVEKFASGAVLEGPSAEEMTRILGPAGKSWAVQDGRLQILGDRETEGTALLLSPSSGLVGSPEYGDPPAKGKPAILKARALLRPEALPGRLVALESREVVGNFRAIRVVHSGDTRGPDYYTDFELVAL
jgi:hypothetical protein